MSIKKETQTDIIVSMQKPFFSIIIPTLNEEKFLSKILRDLTKQAYKNFEVIVVDGKSTDKTVSVASRFVRELPSLTITTAKKRNLSHQRNVGGRLAKGKWLIFFDADVGIPTNFLKAIKKAADDGAVFMTTYIQPDSTLVYDESFMRLTNLIVEISRLIGKPFVVGANTIVTKSVFERVGEFDEHVIHAEDYSFTQKVKDAGFPLTILKSPKLTFSLRRYRAEGRLAVLRKNATAALHVLTMGPITRDLFSYQMGGEQYATLRKLQKPLNKKTRDFLEKKVKETIEKLFI